MSLDLTTSNERGEAWDFNDPRMRQDAERKVIRERPTVLMVSPVREAFSTLQNRNYANMDPEDVRKKIQHGVNHLQFAMDLCRIQWEASRYFAFEHPWASLSWSLPVVRNIAQLPGVGTVNVHGEVCDAVCKGIRGQWMRDKRGEEEKERKRVREKDEMKKVHEATLMQIWAP